MTSPPLELVGVVLAGGASRRMGRNKATLEVGGTALAVRVARALVAGGCRHVEIQGGDAAQLAPLGFPVHTDRAPGTGPVTAIADVLARHDGPAGGSGVVVAACDLPDLDAATVQALLAAGTTERRPTIATVAGRLHLVLYLPPGSRRRWDAAVATGVTSLRAAAVAVDAVPVDVTVAAVRNVNTPEDLRSPDDL